MQQRTGISKEKVLAISERESWVAEEFLTSTLDDLRRYMSPGELIMYCTPYPIDERSGQWLVTDGPNEENAAAAGVSATLTISAMS